MAAGTPVLSSDAASMPEICGDAVLYFNPYDINQLAQKILEILNNDELVMKYITRGRKHVEKYTWDKTAFQTSNIIKNLLERD
jgi:glycosyltransferase involved in cell wall biosynthesis